MNCSWQTAMSTGIRGSLLAAASRDSGCCQLFRRVHGVMVIALAVSVPAMVVVLVFEAEPWTKMMSYASRVRGEEYEPLLMR